MPNIDGQRVIADLKRLAEFGRYKTGVHRPTYSPVDVESRHWLAGKLREAGLDPVIDGIGNVIGRNPSAGRRLLVGSHSETQPYGGWLDGSLGVIYGLELARAFAADPAAPGSASRSLPGPTRKATTRAFSAAIRSPTCSPKRNRPGPGRDDGTPLREALQRAGLCRTAARAGRSEHYVGYLEAHIEQGDTLDTSGCASASSRRSSASGTTGSPSPASRTMPARPACCGARTPAPRWCASRRHPRPLPRDRRPAHGVDDRPHADRAERALGHPRPRRDAGPVPRRRSRSLALFEDVERACRRCRSGRPLPCCDRADRAQQAGADGSGFQALIEAAAEHHAPGLHMRLPSGAGHDAASWRADAAGDDVRPSLGDQPPLVRGH